MSDFLIKRDISDAPESLSMPESLLQIYIKIAEKGWEEIQKILSVSESDPEYWERSEIQEELKNLYELLDIRGHEGAQGTENHDIGMNLKEFVRGSQSDFLKVSWDFEFFSNSLIVNTENEIPYYLYPEDILSLFMILDRTILFHSEIERFKRYEFMHQHIKLLNEKRNSRENG